MFDRIFKIDIRINFKDVCKLLFLFAGNIEQSFILLFYLFDLFDSPCIIPVDFNSF